MRTALLGGAVALLEARGARPALIGAMALAFHGIGRATQDVDLLVLDRSVLRADFWKPLAADGAAVAVRRGDAEDPLAGLVHLSRPGAAALDVIVGKQEWHWQVLDRRIEVPLGGQLLYAVRAAPQQSGARNAGPVRGRTNRRNGPDRSPKTRRASWPRMG